MDKLKDFLDSKVGAVFFAFMLGGLLAYLILNRDERNAENPPFEELQLQTEQQPGLLRLPRYTNNRPPPLIHPVTVTVAGVQVQVLVTPPDQVVGVAPAALGHYAPSRNGTMHLTDAMARSNTLAGGGKTVAQVKADSVARSQERVEKIRAEHRRSLMGFVGDEAAEGDDAMQTQGRGGEQFGELLPRVEEQGRERVGSDVAVDGDFDVGNDEASEALRRRPRVPLSVEIPENDAESPIEEHLRRKS